MEREEAMLFSKDGLSRIDYTLVLAVIILVVIGILMIYSAGFDPIEKVNNGLYRKQILWFIFGFILMVGLTIINYQALGEFSLHIYAVLIVVLLITAIFGRPVRNTRAWLNFGVIAIQPSEFMKLGLVIILAKYLEVRERDIVRLRELVIPTILTFIPVLIILKQPDFGTAIIFIPILLTMLFVGGADITHLISIVLIASIAMVVPMILTYREWIGAEGSNFILDFFKDVNLLLLVSGVMLAITIAAFVLHYFSVKKILRKIYIPGAVVSLGLMASVLIQNLFKVYQKRRILVFLNPDLDPQGSGYNIIQSKIAIGSGGLFGKGFLKGSQSQLGFLPEKTSDFIFSVVAEEWGFLGGIVMIGLLGFLVFKCIQTAFEAKDKFGALLASGITTIFFFHVLVNIGMVIGIMPVTGLPLCFVSYGGSNLLMSMICVGIILNIRARKFVY
ncbi:MAG: rod shape-determining protein RodA [Spirochaetes bacterium]|nr:rod shape-determining protein RodA [Spirochaetota bacterium]